MGIDEELKRLFMEISGAQQAVQGQAEALEAALGSALSLLRENPVALAHLQASLAERSSLIAADPKRTLGERDAFESTRKRLEAYMGLGPGLSGRIGGGTVQ